MLPRLLVMSSDIRHSHSVGLYPDTIWLPLVYPGDRPLSAPSSDTERLSEREGKRTNRLRVPAKSSALRFAELPFH